MSIATQAIMAEADSENDFELKEEPHHTEPYLFEPEDTEEEQEAAIARQAAVQSAVAKYPLKPRSEDPW